MWSEKKSNVLLNDLITQKITSNLETGSTVTYRVAPYSPEVYASFECYGQIRGITEGSYIFPEEKEGGKINKFETPRYVIKDGIIEAILWFEQMLQTARKHELTYVEVLNCLIESITDELDRQAFLIKALSSENPYCMLHLLLMVVRFYGNEDIVSWKKSELLNHEDLSNHEMKTCHFMILSKCQIYYIVSLAYNVKHDLRNLDYIYICLYCVGSDCILKFKRQVPNYHTCSIEMIMDQLFRSSNKQKRCLLEQEKASRMHSVSFDKENSTRIIKCHCCGEIGHYRYECSHKGNKCTICGKKGHLAKVCYCVLVYDEDGHIVGVSKQKKNNTVKETKHIYMPIDKWDILQKTTDKLKCGIDEKKENTQQRAKEINHEKVTEIDPDIVVNNSITRDLNEDISKKLRTELDELHIQFEQIKIRMEQKIVFPNVKSTVCSYPNESEEVSQILVKEHNEVSFNTQVDSEANECILQTIRYNELKEERDSTFHSTNLTPILHAS